MNLQKNMLDEHVIGSQSYRRIAFYNNYYSNFSDRMKNLNKCYLQHVEELEILTTTSENYALLWSKAEGADPPRGMKEMQGTIHLAVDKHGINSPWNPQAKVIVHIPFRTQ